MTNPRTVGHGHGHGITLGGLDEGHDSTRSKEVLTQSLWNRGEALQVLLERSRRLGRRVETAPRVRQRQKHLNRKERAEVVKQYVAGESMGKLETSFGCHRSAIKRGLLHG